MSSNMLNEIEEFITTTSVSPMYAVQLRRMAEEAVRNGGRHFCVEFEGGTGVAMREILLDVGVIEPMPSGDSDHYQFPRWKRLAEIAERINEAKENDDAPLLPPIVG